MTNIAPGSQSLIFDRGIESITFARDQGGMKLPERAQSAPPEMGSRPQLSVLLDRPSLDDAISGAIRPPTVDRDLLVPVKFREALDGALQRLSEEVNLRDLVQMYRSALYQG